MLNIIFKIDNQIKIKVTLEQFLISPISCPVWKTLRHFSIQQNDPMLKKWWAKVVGDGKGDANTRLNKYLQALDYFITLSNQFWTQMSINPTSYTIEAMAVRLTAMGDWIRASGIDVYGWAEKFYLVTKSLVMDEPNGQAIFKSLELIWPAGLKGNIIHYEQNPFAKADFVINEGVEQVVISPALKMYKFNPDKVWTENATADPEPSPPITKVLDEKSSKKRKLESNNQKEVFIPASLDSIDSDDEDGHAPFAMIDSNYSLQ